MRLPARLFGMAVLLAALGLLASVPGASLLAAGYLLEAQGRRARAEPWSEALPHWAPAARVGAFLLGLWLCLLPARVLWSVGADATLVSAAGAGGRVLLGLALLAGVAALLHALGVLAGGGHLKLWLHPMRSARALLGRVRPRADRPGAPEGGERRRAAGAGLAIARASLAALARSLALGLRGVAAVALWLTLPILALAAADAPEGPRFALALAGGAALIGALLRLPIVLTHLAATGSLRAAIELGEARARWRRAPLAWLAVYTLSAGLSVLLLLTQVLRPPPELAWLPGALCLLLIFPLKLLMGWAYARAGRAAGEAPRWVRLPARMVAVVVVAGYVLLLALSPTIAAQGKAVLFAHPALYLAGPVGPPWVSAGANSP